MFTRRLRIVASTLIAVVLLYCSTPTQASPLIGALWLVTDNATHTQLAMRPIDPVTLQDIPDFEPISMGHNYVTALNADQTLLAAIIWPNENNNADVSLHLIDLTTWTDHTTPTKFDGYVSAFRFSPDGKSLFWLALAARDYSLYTCEVANCSALTPVLTLPSGFLVQAAQWIDSGSQLAIFGIPTDTDWMANGAPYIVFADLAQRKITSTLIVDGLDAGAHPVKDASTQKTTHFEDNRPGLAWDLNAKLLYIAHPTEATITVVDLVKHTIKQQVRPSISKVAGRAKGMQSGTQRLALLGPAGDRLYVSSFVRKISPLADGKFNMSQTPAGVRLIDTRQMQQIQRADFPLFEISLSPDGRYLVATGTTMQQPSEGVGSMTTNGLYILDAVTFEVLRHIEAKDRLVYLHGFSANSQYAYIGLASIEPSEIPPTLNVIDLTTHEFVHKRPLPTGYSELFGTLNPLK